MTLPDSETFVPEFGLCLAPDIRLDFDSDISTEDEEDHAINLSDPLKTPISRTDFNLPDYNTLLNDGGSGFGDGSDGFSNHYDYDDDDILRNADDADTLDFNLDSTPTKSRKRTAREDSDISHKRVYASGEGTDDEIHRIARQDHDIPDGMADWPHTDEGGFGEPLFTDYQTPPPPESFDDVFPPPVKKKRRIAIIEDDSATVQDSEFRLWPQKYREMQRVAKARRRNYEMGRIAKENAMKLLWSWGGRSERELPETLRGLFSKEALLKRWKRDGVGGRSLEKRKRDGEEAVEIGLGTGEEGFGDTGGFGDYAGGFDPIDISVSLLSEPGAYRRQRKSPAMQTMPRTTTLLFNYCRCPGIICLLDPLRDKILRIRIHNHLFILVEADFEAVSPTTAVSTIMALVRVLLFNVVVPLWIVPLRLRG